MVFWSFIDRVAIGRVNDATDYFRQQRCHTSRWDFIAYDFFRTLIIGWSIICRHQRFGLPVVFCNSFYGNERNFSFTRYYFTKIRIDHHTWEDTNVMKMWHDSRFWMWRINTYCQMRRMCFRWFSTFTNRYLSQICSEHNYDFQQRIHLNVRID